MSHAERKQLKNVYARVCFFLNMIGAWSALVPGPPVCLYKANVRQVMERTKNEHRVNRRGFNLQNLH